MNHLSVRDAQMWPRQGAEGPPFAWLPHHLAFLRRNVGVILLFFGLLNGLGVVYLLTATSQFTATATVLIDPDAPKAFKQTPIAINDALSQSSVVDSQLEILQSESVARKVVDNLKLLDNDAFAHPPISMGGQLRALIQIPLTLLGGSDAPMRLDQREVAAAQELAKMEKVRRVGQSNVLEMQVRTTSAELSASLANALVQAFIGDQLEARYDDTRRATAWMEDHIIELHNQAVAADAAAQQFRDKHTILNTDKGQVDQQSLGELLTTLSAAKSRTAEAQAKLDRMQAIVNGARDPRVRSEDGYVDGATADSLGNEVIVRLRQQYLDDAQREAEWAQRFGGNHAAVVALRTEMANIKVSIQSELNRILQSYASELQVAQSSQIAIQASYDAAVSLAAASNNEQVTLRALQSSADTYSTIYQNFLQRYTMAAQDQSFPISEARLITSAAVPLHPSWPRKNIVLGIASVLGLGLGMAMAFVRETLHRGLHTAGEARLATAMDCIGMIPRIVGPRELTSRSGRKILETAVIPGRAIRLGMSPLYHAINAPLSTFSEAMRRLNVSLLRLGRDGSPSVIGCVSAEAGEGKSTILCNLALLIATSGRKVILLDWDLRKRTLTQALAPDARLGLADVASGDAKVIDAIYHDPMTGLDFLPAGRPNVTNNERHASEVLGLAGTANLIRELRGMYQIVLIDLPPLEAVADAQGVDHLMDVLFIVAEWAKTDRDLIAEGVEELRLGGARVLGLVLNKVDYRRLRHYAAPASRSYSQPASAQT